MKKQAKLNALKQERNERNKKLAELTDEELEQVIGGKSAFPTSDIRSSDVLKITITDSGIADSEK